jgi:hypothetical protein
LHGVAVNAVGYFTWHDIEREMLKLEGTLVLVRASCLSVKVDEHDKVGDELLICQVTFSRALSQVDLISRGALAGFHLNEEFSCGVVGVDDQVASGEVGSQSRGVICGDAIHPTFGSRCRFANFAVRLCFSQHVVCLILCGDIAMYNSRGLTGRAMSGTPRAAGAPVARRGKHEASAATSERRKDVRSMAW